MIREPMVFCGLPVTIGSDAGKVSYPKLLIAVEALAPHAGYLKRIHWDQAHSAHGVVIGGDIGRLIGDRPFGLGDGELPIMLWL